MKIYGSEMCPDCIECKANLDYYEVPYEFIDINLRLRNLKEFLDLRDHLPVFDHCKEIGDIGLPALVLDDGTVTLRWKELLRAQGKEPLEAQSGASCSLSGEGC